MKRKKKTEPQFPRGDDPESMLQQDHLLIQTMKHMLEGVLELGPDEQIYVTYSSGHRPSCNLHFVVRNLDGYQLKMLSNLQSRDGYEPTDEWPRVEVNIFSGHLVDKEPYFVEYTGEFEVEVEFYFTEEKWNAVLAEVHEAKKKPMRKK